MKHTELVKQYHELAFTSNYLFGFPYKKEVYAIRIHNMDIETLEAITCLDRDSKTHTVSLRFCPNNAQKELLISKGAVKQGYTDDELHAWALKYAKGNRGSMFEKLETEKAGQVWKKDKVPFTVDADLWIDEVPYQLKYAKATFTNEATLKNLSGSLEKALWFDMDGTIADLYGVKGWLDMLTKEDETPYKEAKPMVDTKAFAEMLNKVKANGYKIGIISWLSKGSTKSYDEKVAEAKREWLKKYISVEWDSVNIVAYGTNKASVCGNGFLFDDEEPNRNNWNGNAYGVDNILGVLKNF